MEDMIIDMIEGADKVLKKKFRRRVAGEGEEKIEEKKWFNEKIKAALKKKKEIRYEWRYCKEEDKKEWEEKLEKQKRVVQKLVREAVSKYEIELTIKMRSENKKSYFRFFY